MMGLFNGLQNAGQQLRGKASRSDDAAPEGSEPDETSVLDENEGSIIASLISQLRIGMDLSKVTFPTFVLEPRSMLERITDFMSHPELIFGAESENDPEERFLRVLSYYLAGWHIKPKGVKKPYNPVLGEFFRCQYDYANGTKGFYIAEQVSHHPPISAYFYISPANKLLITGELRPKSKFLGNSVATVMEGENRVTLLGRPDDGEYVLEMPNMYARGILWGRMVLELADQCVARNEKTGITCEMDFKAKGFFSGTYNSMSGKVKHKGSEMGDISGKWSDKMYFTPAASSSQKRMLFDARTMETPVPQSVAPEEEQEANESRRLWRNLTKAIQDKNMDAATEAKSSVEEGQRESRRKREESGNHYVPRFFELRDNRWMPKIKLPQDPTQDPNETVKLVRDWIWSSAP
ncbi:Oxysterol-binding protein [Exidia glandulosa HHB12029]|uniref:Oxysterol-binding protein n=1 Tax=Exidia glandulosa HHB12029 TaxID=1314781 RepID=A0A165PFC2_EXIGL|nr:Oxysterol-binding protein [Exidia glandulosa HHB12029]